MPAPTITMSARAGSDVTGGPAGRGHGPAPSGGQGIALTADIEARRHGSKRDGCAPEASASIRKSRRSMMAGINYGRVLLGGLVAGIVANVCDTIVGMFIMADDMQRMVQRLGLDQRVFTSTSTMVTWVVVDFIYATLIVWTYAAVRPRLGPGPTTAMIVGAVICAAATVVLFGFQQMGVFTIDSFIKNAVLSLATALLASLAGAKVYRD
jgi:hypothetical protein